MIFIVSKSLAGVVKCASWLNKLLFTIRTINQTLALKAALIIFFVNTNYHISRNIDSDFNLAITKDRQIT